VQNEFDAMMQERQVKDNNHERIYLAKNIYVIKEIDSYVICMLNVFY